MLRRTPSIIGSLPRRRILRWRSALLACLAGLTLAACGQKPGPEPIPSLPKQDDLYAYSLAVAKQARAKVVHAKSLGTVYVGQVHERFGSQEKALEKYREALIEDPLQVEAHRRIGFVLSQSGDPEGALEAYQQVLLAAPSSTGIRTRMGMVFHHMGRFEDAERVLKDEVERKLADAFSFYNLGQAQMMLNKAAEASASYRRALEMSPAMREALHGLSRSLRKEGKRDEAKEVDKRFTAIKEAQEENYSGTEDPKANTESLREWTAETWSQAGELFLAEVSLQGDAKQVTKFQTEADRAAEQSLSFNANNGELHRFLLKRYLALGQKDKARKIAESTIESVKDETRAIFEATLYIKDLSPESVPTAPTPEILKVIEGLRNALELSPSNNEYRLALAEVILFRAVTPDYLGEGFDCALTALETAQPATAHHYSILGLAHFRRGRVEQSIEVMTRGVQLFPKDTRLRERLEKLENLPRRN